MKKILTATLIAILATSLFGQTENISKWQSTSLTIDGNVADWLSRPPYYDNVTKLAFDIRNDGNNLYLVFQMPEQRTQLKMAGAGMSLIFETKIKPKRKAGIYFSPFMNEKTGPHKRNDGDLKGPSIVQQKYLLSPPDVLASGFAFSDGDIWGNKDTKKVAFFANWDTLNCMTIEFQIPLRELFGENFDLKKVAEQEISMTLQENAIEKPETPADGNATGTGNNPGGGFQHSNSQGMGGQDMGGQGGQGGQGEHQYKGGNTDRSKMFEAQILKQKIKLNTDGKY
jgi:hypothetical protein